MKRYIVKAVIMFYDYEGKEVNKTNDYITRKANDIFECSKERYLYLKKNEVIELMAILN